MFTAFLLAAALDFTPADADFAYKTAATLVERYTPRDAGTVRGRNAALFIFDTVSALGPNTRLDSFVAATPAGARRFNNVECDIVSDKAAPWIVFISHFDTKSSVACPGANDGASTSGLLIALAGRVHDAKVRGVNVRFLWTDGEECMKAYSEEDGFWGSRRAAARLAEERLDVKGVFCLDMLGDTNLVVTVPHNGTDSLKPIVLAAAKAAGVRDKVRLGRTSIKDDHIPFLERGFPAVTLIDFEYGSAPGKNDWWHTPSDTMDKVSQASLLISGRLAISLLHQFPTYCLTPDLIDN